jgi:hypothetical protein
MDFDPLNSEHAIQSVAFTVAFDGMLSPGAIHDLRSRTEIIAELPAVQAPQGFEFNMGGAPTGGGPIQRRMIAGVQLSHLRPDGTPAWALRMMGNELSVECTRYTRWDKVWGTASR